MSLDKLFIPRPPLITEEHFQSITISLENHFKPHGKDLFWEKVLLNIPTLLDSDAIFSDNVVQATSGDRVNNEYLRNALKDLMPWRKGPFHLLGVYIDAEWRSDLKWQRLVRHIAPPKDRKVLDIGCGNGYYLFRSLGRRRAICVGCRSNPIILLSIWALQNSSLLTKRCTYHYALSNYRNSIASIQSFRWAFSIIVVRQRSICES